jgi:hypothetical protein
VKEKFPRNSSPPQISFDWNPIHAAVQEGFEKLASRILDQEPEASSKAARCSTRSFALFSYRVFPHLDGNDYDPIVIGISFAPTDDRVRIMGDISGDESGFVYFDEGCTMETTQEPQAVMEYAKQIAESLAAQESAIIDAIRNRHPCALPK